ncbi:MAG TPA: hypothetical protein VL475_03165, partial [Planctomycetaceae bacterium]|nr:hypothetical protein [Planctomycetaceae bacterium]
MEAGISAAILVCCGLVGQTAQDVGPDPLLTGKPFRVTLDRPFAATWENVSLRTISRRIVATQHTAILLDRRLDPTCEHSIAATGEPLRAFLERLAAQAGGKETVVGNTVFLGPPVATQKLRTLVWLRQQELSAEGSGVPKVRRFALTQTAPCVWDDLTRPVDLVRRLAAEYQLEVERLERVPHDLWAGAVIPDATVIEALSLILV